ncbi:MAG TPA: hypothetical protein VMI54_05800 [Polyangiaceae bacterium]|nr:hypothetical protein [Polyangiaceae bacterium]
MALPPEPVPEYAAACLEYVRRALGFELDFTAETLPVLDHYVSTVRESLAERPEIPALVARAVGAYFGEVVRTVVPGFWRIPSPNVHDWQLCSRVAFLWVNPVGIAYDAIHGSSEHDGPRSMLRCAPEDRPFLERRLETLPPVPEDQYFLFTTRLEVLEVANEALHARLEEQGYGETELTEEDYASGLEPAPN